MSMTSDDPEVQRYARVLQFIHWALNQPEGKKKQLGELLRLGCEKCQLPEPPPHVEEALLLAAFKLAANEVPYSTVFA